MFVQLSYGAPLKTEQRLLETKRWDLANLNCKRQQFRVLKKLVPSGQLVRFAKHITVLTPTTYQTRSLQVTLHKTKSLAFWQDPNI